MPRIERADLRLAWIVLGCLWVTSPAFAEPRYPVTPADFRATEVPAPVQNAWDATVHLSTRSWQGASSVPIQETGSGVVLAQDAQGHLWIATSAHVVPCGGRCLIRVTMMRQTMTRQTLPRKTLSRKTLTRQTMSRKTLPQERRDGRTRPRAFVSANAELVWRDAAQDLALLRCERPRNARVAVASTTAAPSAGAVVTSVGYPDLRLLGEKRRARSAPDKRLSSGRLLTEIDGLSARVVTLSARHAAQRITLRHALTHDAALLPGSSGGPLIDAQGRVVAINTGSLTRAGEASCAEQRERCDVHLAVPVGQVLKHLKSLAE